MEDRMSFQKKHNVLASKLRPVKDFKMWTWYFTGSMPSQATAWHLITGHTPESLLVKLKY